MVSFTSPEFLSLCKAQVGLLGQGMGAAWSAIYLRDRVRSQAEANLLPVATYPEPSPERSEGEGYPEVILLPEEMLTANALPKLLSPGLSDVPTALPSASPSEASSLLRLQDKLVLPLVHEGVVMGFLVAVREDRAWEEGEKFQIERVARTVALACILDQRSQWFSRQLALRQQQERQQRDLLHNVLHQLRNPLTALQTFGKLLLKRLQPEDTNRNVASNILRESDRLKDLLEDLQGAIDVAIDVPVDVPIDVPWSSSKEDWQADATTVADASAASKPAAATPTAPTPLLPASSFLLQSVWLVDVLKPLLMSAEAIAADRGLTLKQHIPEELHPVRADARALREVLSNLIENALKYTPVGGEVRVEVMAGDRQEHQGFQRITISDTGCGIPPEDLERVFERHYRGVQATSAIPGSGLGLAIARELVMQMQGDIQACSPCPKGFAPSSALPGTTFTVWLPEVGTL